MRKFLCLGVMGLWAGTAQASLVLEWNFDNPTNPHYASYSNGVNGATTLVGTSAVVPGGVGTPTGPGTGVVSALQANSLRVPSSAWTNGGMNTTAVFTNVFSGGTANFASGTVALVFRPSVIAPGSRQWLFNVGAPGSHENIGFYTDAGSGSSKSIVIQGGRAAGGAGENFFNMTTPSISWDTNDWYFIAMSWQSSSGIDAGAPNNNGSFLGLPDGKLSIYLHSMRDGQTGTYTPDGSALVSTNNDTMRVFYPVNRSISFLNVPLNIARRSNADFTGGGDYAFLQVYDEYMNANQLNSVFVNEFIPEPSAVLLVACGAVFFFRTRR